MGGMQRRIRVMIVDDHPLFRNGLQRALELHDDLLIVGVSADGEQALVDAQATRPEVILLDINLPRLNGLQVTQQLLANNNRPPAVIILTAHHDDDQILQSFGNGVSAYSTKDVHPDDLVEIIRAVAAGYYVVNGTRMTPQEFALWLHRERSRQMSANIDSNNEHPGALSAREMEILSYVTDGLLNKEIAQELGISQQTVKNHITSILKKLNVKDRTQAAVTALKRGWVRLNGSGEQENER